MSIEDAVVDPQLEPPPTQAMAMPAPDAVVVVGDRYELGARIGRGGLADVYEGHDRVLHRSVAIKLCAMTSQDDKLRFDNEVRLVAAVSHPGVVTVFDAGVAPGELGDSEFFIVMELVRGQTLGQRLAGGPMPEAEVRELGTQLAAALRHVHELGIVHRDVKPANIILEPATEDAPFVAKLTDFGIAHLIGTDRMTSVGDTVGTANYLSPEQLTGSAIGPAADIYAFGLLLLEALTGNVAFPGRGLQAAIPRLHRPPDIPTFVPPQWAALLRSMTSMDVDERPTAQEVSRQLAAMGATAPNVPDVTLHAPTAVLPVVDADDWLAPRTAPTASVREPLRSRRALLAVIGALAIAVVIAFIALSGGGTKHPAGANNSPTPKPSYPAVPGPIGAHLVQLENAVG